VPVGYVNEDRSHGFVLVLSCRVSSALSLKKGAFETCLIRREREEEGEGRRLPGLTGNEWNCYSCTPLLASMHVLTPAWFGLFDSYPWRA